jgi:hypothetical protein
MEWDLSHSVKVSHKDSCRCSYAKDLPSCFGPLPRDIHLTMGLPVFQWGALLYPVEHKAQAAL